VSFGEEAKDTSPDETERAQSAARDNFW